MLLFFHWLTAICSICFILILNDFVFIWLGSEYTLEIEVVAVIVINFYIQNIINPVWIYRETMGLFNQIKYIMIIAAIINIVLSIILGIYWGLAGIIISTALSRLLTTVWYEPRMLFKLKFQQSVWKYWGRQLRYSLVTVIAGALIILSTSFFDLSIIGIILKVIFAVVVSSFVFFLTSYKTEEFLTIKSLIINIIRR